MFRRVLLVLVIGALAACAPAPPAAPDTAADEAKLKADALVWFDHYNKGDAAAVANLYAEDATIMPPGAPNVTGRAGIQTFIAGEIAKTQPAGIMLKNASITGVGISGDTGWLSGTYVVVDGTGTTLDSGSYLSVHRRAGGSWPYIRDTWNSDRPPAPAPPAPTDPKKGKE